MFQLCSNYATMFQLCFNYVSTMFQLQIYDAPRNTPQPMLFLMLLSGWHAILIRSQDRCRAVRRACNAARTPGGGRRGTIGWEGSRNATKQSPAEPSRAPSRAQQSPREPPLHHPSTSPSQTLPSRPAIKPSPHIFPSNPAVQAALQALPKHSLQALPLDSPFKLSLQTLPSDSPFQPSL